MTKNIYEDKGNGYLADSGLICMIRCFSCGKENWAMSVAAGHCAWCGFDPNLKENKDERTT